MEKTVWDTDEPMQMAIMISHLSVWFLENLPQEKILHHDCSYLQEELEDREIHGYGAIWEYAFFWGPHVHHDSSVLHVPEYTIV